MDKQEANDKRSFKLDMKDTDVAVSASANRTASNADFGTGDIQELGYAPVYRRVFHGLGTFALVLAVASPVAGIAIAASSQILYGGYWGLVWGWIIPAVLFLPQPIAIAELCSSMPVNGANYWWTAALAPPAYSRFASFILGWLTIAQVFTALASVSYASATSLAMVITSLQPSWQPTNAQTMLMAMAVLVCWGLTSLLRMERFAVVIIASCAIVILSTLVYIIGLPAAHAARDVPFASASDVFGLYTNYSDWDQPVAVPMSFFTFAWVVTGWNSPSFVAEETKNGNVVCPRSIMHTYAAMVSLGGLVCILTAFCITDIGSAAADPSGLPLYTLLFENWGFEVACAFFAIGVINSLVGGSSYLLTCASQMAAFARDGGLPFSETLAYVHPTTNMPVYSQVTLVVGSMLILLFGLSDMARNIIFSLAVIANFLMMAPPMILRVFPGDRFVPGPFTMGRFSKPIHAFASLTLIYMTVMLSFPATRHWEPSTFNYNWAVALGSLLASVAAWCIIGHRYKGLDLAALHEWREHTNIQD